MFKNKDSAAKKVALPAKPDGANELYIPYSITRATIRDRLDESKNRINLKRGLIFLGLILTYTALTQVLRMIPHALAIKLVPFLYMFFFIVIFFVTLPIVFAPTNLQIGRQGIRLHWLSMLGCCSSPWITLDCIRYVDCSNMSRGLYSSKALDIYLDLGALAKPDQLKARFFTLPLTSLHRVKEFKLRLDLQAITYEEDVKSLVNAMVQLLPADKLDERALNLTENFEDSTFTKLWLENFDGKNSSSENCLQEGDLAAERYRVIERLQGGGQAAVYLANDITTETDADGGGESKQVVLKEFVLPAKGGIEIRRRALENVEHEAKILKKLEAPNIVRLLDCFATAQRAYLVLEHIKGASLRVIVKREGPLPVPEVLILADRMCDILIYLHSQTPPVVHRDFTPDNLMFSGEGQLYLIDFNVAETLESNITRTMVGKHSYVPPEQFRGKATTQSDIYALGATLYFLLTGRDPQPISVSNPFTEENASDPIEREPNETSKPALGQIIAKATALEASQRYQDCRQMKKELEPLIGA
ncbi:MAG: serine/threonine protein kinase [Candidatus Obscuribacterales bacterium]|nr:serine/threonine protein kinase [Candidatus Obscuribacterales bacterium]